MLYATDLGAEMVLALIFDAETSFTTIRTQANRLVRSLSSSPSGEDEEEGLPPNLTPISEILADVPPPNPPQEMETELHTGGLEYDLSPTRPVASPRAPASVVPLAVDSEPRPAADESALEETVAAPAQKRGGEKQQIEDLEATLPSPTTELARKIVLVPVSPSAYNLTYACLLIPRFVQHHLTGDLAERLSTWMPQLCVAYGWRLEYLAIRPEYLQWIVNVPPPTPPSYVMRLVRQQTSAKIFEEFPRYKKENPSGDFWAPGYLIMGGNQPHPAQLVKDFITQIRQRQGFTRRPR
jgi:REP element-mobilizing transposase RayT